MSEATSEKRCGWLQVLCDRLGIFVDGQLVCIGNPKELTARYGGYVVRITHFKLCLPSALLAKHMPCSALL